MLRLTTAVCSVALLLAWGCAEQSFGGSALCGNALGANGEVEPDCANPSCQALEACRLLPPAPPTQAIAGGHADPPIVDESPLPPPDQSASAVPSDSNSDPTPQPDAAPLPPQKQKPKDTSCAKQGACNSNQGCKGNDCAPAEKPLATNITITQIAIVAPRSVDGGATCLDSNDACVGYSVSPILRCGCAPTPIVVVRVDGELVGETAMSTASDIASWETLIEFKLKSDSTISLQAFDLDDEARQEIFGCEFAADSEQIAAGKLSCTMKFPTNAGLLDFSISATLTSRYD